MNRIQFRFEILWRTHLIMLVCVLLAYVIAKENLFINKWYLIANAVTLLLSACWYPVVQYIQSSEVQNENRQ